MTGLGAGAPLLILAKICNALRAVVVIRAISAAVALLLMTTVVSLQAATGYFILVAAQALLSLAILLKIGRVVSKTHDMPAALKSPPVC